MPKKAAIIGTLFSDSSSSSSDAPSHRKYHTSVSDNGKSRVRSALSVASADERRKVGGIKRLPPLKEAIAKDTDQTAPDGFAVYNKSRIASMARNTVIRYLKTNDTLVAAKYFKAYDSIANTILVGYFPYDKRNYVEKMDNIKYLYVQNDTNAEDILKGTLLVEREDWKNIKRDTIISYRKTDGDWVYKVKLNAFFKNKDGMTMFSLSSERGYSYRCRQDNLEEIRRHVSDTDMKMSFILKTVHTLEQRIARLEKKIAH